MAKNKKSEAVDQAVGTEDSNPEQSYSNSREQTETTTLRRPGNAPIKKFRARGVFVHVFENVAEDGRKYLKASSPQRTYKEGDQFKTTHSLGTIDAGVGKELLGQAYAFMLEAEAGRADE